MIHSPHIKPTIPEQQKSQITIITEEENDDESDIEQQKKDKKNGHRHTFGVTKKDAPTDTEDNHVPILL